MVSATLRALGGSVIVSLPQQFIGSMNLRVGSEVNIGQEDGHLILKPAKKKYTLAELLDGMEEGDMPYDKSFDQLPTTGNEAI